MAKWCVCGGAVESLRGVKSGGCCGEGATAAKSEAAAAQGRASGACTKGSQGHPPQQDPAEAGLQGLDVASHARLQTFGTHTHQGDHEPTPAHTRKEYTAADVTSVPEASHGSPAGNRPATSNPQGQSPGWFCASF